MDLRDEYIEASENFRSGFKLIFDIGKTFTTVNAFLFAALAIVNTFQKDPANQGTFAAFVVCCLGIMTCIAYIVGQMRMAKYLRIFLKRAKDIEDINKTENKLYNLIYDIEIEGRKRIFNNYNIIPVGFFLVGLLWVILLLGYFGIRLLTIPVI